MNLKQITDKLNAEFVGDVRKLVFWYDANEEFAGDIDTLGLSNAKVYHLENDNQFQTKYFLEREDTTTNYLIYAPFAKPSVRDNHLADTIKYSKEFFADRASLLTLDLGIDEKYKPVIQKYIKFFAAKDRTQKFYDLEIETFNKNTIEIALMSVLCKTKTASFEEIVRVILTDDGFENNRFLDEFEKYELLAPFWRMCEEQFGYTDVKPTLEKLVYTLFVTYAGKSIHADLPQAWKNYSSYKSGNIIAFLDSLMNSILYRERFDEISEMVLNGLNGMSVLEKYPADSLVDCDTFAAIDLVLIKWMIDRLQDEDLEAKLNGLSIPQVCQNRRKKHFGSNFKAKYFILENAYYLILAARYVAPNGIKNVTKQYVTTDYLIDRRYRYFYYFYDQISDNSSFEKLRDLIENIYTNEYLNKLAVEWNAGFVGSNADSGIQKQTDFYSKYIKIAKERVVVIVSDALRYEVGHTLWEKLLNDEKCTATIEAMQSVLPSYTRLGMGALLPHRTIEMSEDYKILVDGKPCDDLKQREAILQNYSPNSNCVQFDDIKTMKVAQLRELFTGKDVVYVYHNQIDARGDKLNTENEVFTACEEAIEEIYALIKRLSVSANTVHFIVTADHGFIYKRDKLAESDKIANITGSHPFTGRRYVVSDEAVKAEGIASVKLGHVLGNSDERVISFPIGTDVFKVSGGGQNYVHGGSSPQEMIIPVIDVKTEKGHKDTTTAGISLVSLANKITNLITTLDFIQTEPVSDVVKETSYKIFFISDDNERISNENIYIADKKDIDTQKRVFRLRFNFKNKKYDKARRYYLVAYDDKNNLEIIRHEIVMDLAFADDFGFNL